VGAVVAEANLEAGLENTFGQEDEDGALDVQPSLARACFSMAKASKI